VKCSEAAPKVVELMGKMLKWDKKRKQEELNDVHTFLETMEMSSKDLLRSTYK